MNQDQSPSPRELDPKDWPTERRPPGELTRRFRALCGVHKIPMSPENERLVLTFFRRAGARPEDPHAPRIPRAGFGR